MRKFRIKVEERGEGNLYTPQTRNPWDILDGKWKGYSWAEAEEGNWYGITFDNFKEAQEFIQERKGKETTKTYYL